MATRVYTANVTETLGGWVDDPDATGYYYVLSSSLGGPLIISTSHGIQHIPSTSTITGVVAKSYLVGCDHPGGIAKNIQHALFGADLITITNTTTPILMGTAPAYNDASLYTTNSGTCTPAATSKFSIVYIPAGTGDFPEHWRMKAVSAGFMNGAPPTIQVTFTLPYPTVTTLPVTNATPVSATLNAAVNPNGANIYYPVSYYFEYGLTTSYGTTTPLVNNLLGSSDVGAFANITGLTANTTYHYRVRAVNLDIESLGSDQVFNTSQQDISIYIF